METNKQKIDHGAARIPAQHTGSEMNAVEKLELNSKTEAVYFFKSVKERLLDVNHWTEISGKAMSGFMLMDQAGNLVQRKATTGDHIRIDIPGPGTSIGNRFDWVRIEEIRLEEMDNAEVLSMTVRPSSNPLTNNDDTAHFLTNEATSTFLVKRIGQMVCAEEHGRNEVSNTSTKNILDNFRNAFVGWGAKIGLSYPQWKALVKGLLSKDNPYKSI